MPFTGLETQADWLKPCVVFRRAYDALVRTHGERADVEYLRILQLAATAGEGRVRAVLATVLDQVGGFDYVTVQAQADYPHPGMSVAQFRVADEDALQFIVELLPEQ